MSQATGLDHVGIVGRDLGDLARAFEAVGFHLTPLARHAGGRTGNRCVMLRDGGYLELMSTIDGGTSATLDRFLKRHEGAHLLALSIDDAVAARERLRRTWDKVPDIETSDRAVDDTDPHGPHARFSLIGPFDRPEGRVHLIRHETPEALWQPRFLRHENNAVALEEVILVVPQPAPVTAWYSTVAGRPVVPDASGGFALPLARGRVVICPPDTREAPPPPCMAAIVIRTGDGANAVRKRLTGRGMTLETAYDCIQVRIGDLSVRFC